MYQLGTICAGVPGLLSSVACLLALIAGPSRMVAADPSHSSPSQMLAADEKLLQAVEHADLGLLKAAIGEGANPNCAGTNGLTPLVLLTGATGPLSQAQYDCVAFLLAHGANTEAKDRNGRPPLIRAARAGDLRTVQLLVETGNAYVRTRDRFNMTALLYAAQAHRRDIVDYLASNGDIQSPSVRERKERGRR